MTTGRLRCGVLFALPTDREEFDAVSSGDALPDYRRGLLRGGSPALVWDRRYARVVEAMDQLRTVVADVGGYAFPMATLADLGAASSTCDTLILIAHWRGWQVSESDLRSDARTIEHRLRHAGLGDLLAAGPVSVRGLVATLNEIVQNGMLLRRIAPELQRPYMNPVLAATIGRDLLDELLVDAIDPGNRVELYDGQYVPGEIEEAIDGEFRGDIDLATCSSVALATLISMRRGGQVHLVHTVDAIDPLPCCLIIAATLRYALRHGVSYADARLTVAEHLRADWRH